MTILANHHRFPAFGVNAPGRYHAAHARRACPPGREIPRRVQVGVGLITAGLALEASLAGPVAPRGVATTAAPLTGVARIFLHDLDTSDGGLVAEERDQLGEGPRVQHPADLAGPRASHADA